MPLATGPDIQGLGLIVESDWSRVKLPTCNCSFSFVLVTLNSLLTTEVWVKSRDSPGTRENEAEDRPARLYRLRADALLWDTAMDRSPGEPRVEALPMREEETENRGESPKIFR